MSDRIVNGRRMSRPGGRGTSCTTIIPYRKDNDINICSQLKHGGSICHAGILNACALACLGNVILTMKINRTRRNVMVV